METFMVSVTTTYKVLADTEDGARTLVENFPDGGENVDVVEQDFLVEEAY